jgi:flagellar motor switch/type III secretory pathway protein FliN
MKPAEVLQRFEDLPFDLELELANLEMTIGDILDLREGSVVRTNHPAGVPFTLRAGGVEFATAELVVVGDCVSVRINKLIEKPKMFTGGNGSN